jgi:hypothetical protein
MRNVIYGSKDVGGGNNWMGRGIHVGATCTTAAGCPQGSGDAGYVIENNMIWYTRHNSDATHFRAGIHIESSESVLVQNNTVYAARNNALSLVNSPSIVRNNLFYLTDNRQPIRLTNSAGAVFSHNNIWDDGTDPVLVRTCSSQNDDTTCVDTIRCATIANFGTGNICGPTTFLNVSGDKQAWDLRLAPDDKDNRDAGVAAPGVPAYDFELDERDVAVDIGADEIRGQDSTPPAAPGNVRVP